MKKVILIALILPSILYAKDFPHNTNRYILQEHFPEKREESVESKLRKAERYDYYSIPPESRPSWKEYKSYPPKVKVED